MRKTTNYERPDAVQWRIAFETVIASSFDEAEGVTNEGFTVDPDPISF